VVGDFEAYNQHTEQLICWLLDRYVEDEVLAGGLAHPRWWRLVLSIGPQRENINDYRRAVARSYAAAGALRVLWQRVARFHAWTLRIIAAVYADRAGFDPSWLTPPGRQP
jgi:hypothetical protein